MSAAAWAPATLARWQARVASDRDPWRRPARGRRSAPDGRRRTGEPGARRRTVPRARTADRCPRCRACVEGRRRRRVHRPRPGARRCSRLLRGRTHRCARCGRAAPARPASCAHRRPAQLPAQPRGSPSRHTRRRAGALHRSRRASPDRRRPGRAAPSPSPHAPHCAHPRRSRPRGPTPPRPRAACAPPAPTAISRGTRPCARRGAPRAGAWACGRAGTSGTEPRTGRVPAPCRCGTRSRCRARRR
jgi:hypothetical protein